MSLLVALSWSTFINTAALSPDIPFFFDCVLTRHTVVLGLNFLFSLGKLGCNTGMINPVGELQIIF